MRGPPRPRDGGGPSRLSQRVRERLPAPFVPDPGVYRRILTPPPKETPVLKTIRAILGWALIIALAVLVALIGAPRLFGGATLTVLTGSMQPEINPGDVVAVVPVDPADLAAGDIVTFQPVSGEPTLITHRIISVSQSSSGVRTFITRGDANSADDPQISAEQLQGRVLYSIPFIGHIGSVLGPLAPTLVLVVAVVLVVGGAVVIMRPSRFRKMPDMTQ